MCVCWRGGGVLGWSSETTWSYIGSLRCSGGGRNVSDAGRKIGLEPGFPEVTECVGCSRESKGGSGGVWEVVSMGSRGWGGAIGRRGCLCRLRPYLAALGKGRVGVERQGLCHGPGFPKPGFRPRLQLPGDPLPRQHLSEEIWNIKRSHRLNKQYFI